MKRKSLTAAQRVRVFDAAGGVCHICSLRIQVGEPWDVEHCKPLWLGGADEPSNMRPAHIRCHAVKTAGEAKTRAKTDRVRAIHLGIKPKSRNPIPGSKASGWKRRMDGTVVRRDAR
ncbi:HNH endonuclease [Camelimonas abortus]|uniref:HNH endonuclease n=1 Tax=Camelimonas abortus TaxID=1017184 RepID=A0ABV7LHW6_9HYPH